MIFSAILNGYIKDGGMFVIECALYFLSISYIAAKDFPINKILNIIKTFALAHASLVLLQYFMPSVFYSIVGLISGGTVVAELSSNAANGCYFGFTGQSSTISVYLIVGLALSLFSLKDNVSIRNIIPVIMCIIAIPLTNRRGTFICAILMIIYYVFSLRFKPFYKLLVVVVIAFIITIIGVDNIPGINELFDKVNKYQDSSDFLSGRTYLWIEAIDIFRRNPLFGAGQSSYISLVQTDLPSAHNSYLQKLAELGIVGSFIFFQPHIYSLKQSISKGVLRSYLNNSWVYIALLLYFFISALSEGIYETPCLFIIIYLIQFLVFKEIDKSTLL